MKKLILFAITIFLFSLQHALSQQAYKLAVKQPPPIIITISEAVNAIVGEVVNLDTLFHIEGDSTYFREWQFWDGSLQQVIIDPFFTIPGNGVFCLTIIDECGCTTKDTIVLNLVTAIKDIYPEKGNQQSIHVYPNPNIGKFYITISNCQSGFSVEIINSIGVHLLKKILDCNNNDYSGTITMPAIESGTYYLLVKKGNRTIFRQKVIILNN